MDPQAASKIRIYNVASIAALAAMVLIAAYDFIIPKPRVAVTSRQERQAQAQGDKQAETLKLQVAAAQKDIAQYVWSGSVDQISSNSLSSVTLLAKSKGVTLLAFRPQKIASDAGLSRIPYSIIVEGPYPAVNAFLSSLEQVQNKLAIEMVQEASSDPSTDKVNATINVIAYTLAKKEQTNATATKTK